MGKNDDLFKYLNSYKPKSTSSIPSPTVVPSQSSLKDYLNNYQPKSTVTPTVTAPKLSTPGVSGVASGAPASNGAGAAMVGGLALGVENLFRTTLASTEKYLSEITGDGSKKLSENLQNMFKKPEGWDQTTVLERLSDPKRWMEKFKEMGYGFGVAGNIVASGLDAGRTESDTNATLKPMEDNLKKWADVENESWPVRIISGALQSAPQTIVTMLNPLLGIPIMFNSSLNGNLEQYKEQGLDVFDQKVVARAYGSAAIDSATEYMFNAWKGFKTMGGALKGTSGVKESLTTGVKGFMEGFFKESAEKVVKPTLKNYALFLIKQGTEEGLEEVVSGLGAGLMSEITTNPGQQFISWNDPNSAVQGQGLIDAFSSAFLMAGLMSSANTFQQFKSTRKVLTEVLGDKNMKDITNADVQLVMDTIRQESKTPEAQKELSEAIAKGMNKSEILTNNGKTVKNNQTGEILTIKIGEGDAITMTGPSGSQTVTHQEFDNMFDNQILTEAAPATQTVNGSDLPTQVPMTGVAPQTQERMTVDGKTRTESFTTYETKNGRQGGITSYMAGKEVVIEIATPGTKIPVYVKFDPNEYAQTNNKKLYLQEVSAKAKGSMALSRFAMNNAKNPSAFYESLKRAADSTVDNSIQAIQALEASKTAEEAQVQKDKQTAAKEQEATVIQKSEASTLKEEESITKEVSDKKAVDMTPAQDDKIDELSKISDTVLQRAVDNGNVKKQDADALRAVRTDMEKQGIHGYFNLVTDKNVPKSLRRVKDFIENTSGKQIIFVNTVGDSRVNGFVNDFSKDTVFLNVTERNQMDIAKAMGHEMYHLLVKDGNESLLKDATKKWVNKDSIDKYLSQFKSMPGYQEQLKSSGKVEEEMIADISGEVLTTQEFWQAVADTFQDKKWAKVAKDISKYFEKAGTFLEGSEEAKVLDAMVESFGQITSAPKNTDKNAVDYSMGKTYNDNNGGNPNGQDNVLRREDQQGTTSSDRSGQGEINSRSDRGRSYGRTGESAGGSLRLNQVYEPSVFRERISESVKENPYGAYVEIKSLDEYSKDIKLFLNQGEGSGFAVSKDGDIVSVFKNPKSGEKNAIYGIILTALQNGGNRLDCFAGFLLREYSKSGMVPVARLKWNDEYAPKNWNYERDGRPDIVFMAHNGDSVETVEKTYGDYPKYDISAIPYVEEYDDGVKAQKAYLEKNKSTFSMRPLPENNERVPESGNYPALRTDGGTIYWDTQGRTHVQFATAMSIPAERITSGGWLVDGNYEQTIQSDTMKWVDIEKAKQRIAAKREIARSANLPTLSEPSMKAEVARIIASTAKAGSKVDPKTAKEILDIMLYAKSQGDSLTIGEAVAAHEIYNDPGIFEGEELTPQERIMKSIEVMQNEVAFGEIEQETIDAYGQKAIEAAVYKANSMESKFSLQRIEEARANTKKSLEILYPFDQRGEVPQIFYHGGNFNEIPTVHYDRGSSQFGRAIYFSPGIGVAQEYVRERGGGAKVGEFALDLKAVFDNRNNKKDEKWSNLEKILSSNGFTDSEIKQVFIGSRYGTFEVIAKLLEAKLPSDGKFTYFRRFAEEARSLIEQAGYDSILSDYQDGEQIAVFHSDQIIPLSTQYSIKGTDPETGEEGYIERHRFDRILTDKYLSKPTLELMDDAIKFYKMQPESETVQKAHAMMDTDEKRKATRLKASIIENISPEMTVVRLFFLYEADLRGESQVAADWFYVLNKSGKLAGQAVQAYAIMNKLSPGAQVMHAEREILGMVSKDKLNRIRDYGKQVKKELSEIDLEAAKKVLSDTEAILKNIQRSEDRVQRKIDALDQLETRIKKYMSDTEDYDTDAIKEFIDALHGVTAVTVPIEKMVNTSNPLTFMRWAIRNMDIMQNSMEEAYQMIKRVKGHDTVFIAEIDAYLGEFIPSIDSSKAGSINDTVMASLKSILTTHTDEYLTFNSMVKRLIELGVDSTNAVLVAREARNQIDELTQKQKLMALKKLLPNPDSKATKQAIMKIINVMNERDMGDATVQAYIAKTMGLPNLSPDLQQEIYELGKQITEINMIAASDGRSLTKEEERRTAILMGTMLTAIQRQKPVHWTKKVDLIQSMIMMSMFKSPERNIIGNTFWLIIDTGKDVVASGIDKVLSKFTGNRTIPLPQLGAMLQGAIEGTKNSYYDITHGIDTSAIDTQFGMKGEEVLKSKLGKLAMMVFRLKMSFPDRVQQSMVYQSNLEGIMKMKGETVASQDTIEAAQYEAQYKTFCDDNAASSAFSGLRDLMNNFGRMQYWKSGRQDKVQFGLGSMVVKFPKVPGALLMRTIDYSPISLMKALFLVAKPIADAKKFGGSYTEHFDQKRFAKSLANGTYGTAMSIGVGLLLSMLGLMTGKLPDDEKERAMLATMGVTRGYQLNMSGLWRFLTSGFDIEAAKMQKGDTLTTYSWMAPMAIGMAVGANILQATEKTKEEDAGAIGNAVNATIGSFSAGIDSLMEMTVLSGLKDFVDNFKYSPPLEAVIKSMVDVPASFIPQQAKILRDMLDNTARTTYSNDMLEYAYRLVLNRIPGASETLPAARDVFGNLKEMYQANGNNVWNVFFNPAYATKYTPNEAAILVLNTMAEKEGTKLESTNVTPGNVAKYLTYTDKDGKKQKINLTDYEISDLQQKVGNKCQELFLRIRSDITLEEKVKGMNKILSDVAYAYKQQLLAKKLSEKK